MSGTVHLALSTVPTRYSLVMLNTGGVEGVYRRLRNGAEYALVADGAANRLWKWGQLDSGEMPTHIVGDMDSIERQAEEYFQGVQREVQDSQDFNDCQKCLDLLLALGVSGRVYLLSSMFGRVDHTLACFSSLFDPKYRNLELVMVDEKNTSCALFPGRSSVEIDLKWKICGLIPFERSIVTTTGLQWDLHGDVMEFGGLISSSNKALGEVVTVETNGKLLWTASAG